MKKSKPFRQIPLTTKEWEEIKSYQRVPTAQKLAMLDRMRSLMFEVWKENPELLRQHEEFQNGKIKIT